MLEVASTSSRSAASLCTSSTAGSSTDRLHPPSSDYADNSREPPRDLTSLNLRRPCSPAGSGELQRLWLSPPSTREATDIKQPSPGRGQGGGRSTFRAERRQAANLEVRKTITVVKLRPRRGSQGQQLRTQLEKCRGSPTPQQGWVIICLSRVGGALGRCRPWG